MSSRLKMLSTDDKLAEIRRLYFSATKQTIQNDLAKALDLLKSMPSEEEREVLTRLLFRRICPIPMRPRASSNG